MRARFCAYALGNLEYLESTWHPDYRPKPLSIEPGIRWIGLEIIAVDQRERQATVEFEARLLVDGRVDALHESSDFVLQRDRWVYTSGRQLAPGFTPWKPGRNESCPCGSGRKFKRCCADAAAQSGPCLR